MGWAARTNYRGPGMHNTRTGRARRFRAWTHRQMASALNSEFKIGVTVTRTRGELLHRPSGHGKGKWQSVRTLRAYKVASKLRRQVSSAARAVNRAA